MHDPYSPPSAPVQPENMTKCYTCKGTGWIEEMGRVQELILFSIAFFSMVFFAGCAAYGFGKLMIEIKQSGFHW